MKLSDGEASAGRFFTTFRIKDPLCLPRFKILFMSSQASTFSTFSFLVYCPFEAEPLVDIVRSIPVTLISQVPADEHIRCAPDSFTRLEHRDHMRGFSSLSNDEMGDGTICV